METNTNAIWLSTILNFIFTGILGAVILYVVQRKLNEFKVGLDYANLEKGTRFTKNYEKKTETLANLYQKFSLFAEGFRDMLEDACQPTVTYKISPAKYESNNTNFNDFATYFVSNCFALPSTIANNVQEIYYIADYFQKIISLLFLEPEELTEETITQVNMHIMTISSAFRLGMGTLNWRNANLLMLILQMELWIRVQTDKLEYLYKSVADIQ